jgi:hypothetical protein
MMASTVIAAVLFTAGMATTTYGTWWKDSHHGWEWMTAGYACMSAGAWLLAMTARYPVVFAVLGGVMTVLLAFSVIAWHRQALYLAAARQAQQESK